MTGANGTGNWSLDCHEQRAALLLIQLDHEIEGLSSSSCLTYLWSDDPALLLSWLLGMHGLPQDQLGSTHMSDAIAAGNFWTSFWQW